MLFSYKHLQDGPLNPDCIACTKPEHEKFLLGFSDKWKVILHPWQAHIGSCLVTSRRHVGRISHLTANEITEFVTIVGILEQALEAAFNIDLLNCACLMNWAYKKDNAKPKFKEGKPNPHVHWHLITRCAQPIHLEGYRFEDPEFGDPYDPQRHLEISVDIKETIRKEILNKLDVEYINLVR